MGRFFKTTAGQYIQDKMSQLPVEMMMKVIDKKENAFDRQLKELEATKDIYKNLSFRDEDKGRVAELLKGYEDKSKELLLAKLFNELYENSIVKKVLTDMLNYRNNILKGLTNESE